jgi:hypothetical protein
MGQKEKHAMNDEYHSLRPFSPRGRHNRPQPFQSTAILLPLANKGMEARNRKIKVKRITKERDKIGNKGKWNESERRETSFMTRLAKGHGAGTQQADV